MNPINRHPLDGTCSNCGIAVVGASIWRKWSLEERVASGKRMRRNDKCTRCSAPVRDRKTWKLEHLIEEAEHLLKSGESVRQTESRVGLKVNSLAKAYDRARDKGLTTRKIPYTKEAK